MQLVHTVSIANSHAPVKLWRRVTLLKYQRIPKYYDHGCMFQKTALIGQDVFFR